MSNFGSYIVVFLLAFTPIFSCSSKEAKSGSPANEENEEATQVADDAALSKVQGGDLGYGDDARLFDSPADAMKAIMEVEPQIIGFGEYHKLTSSANVQSALSRFADEILDVVGPKTAHLVLETWSVDPSCGKKGKAVTKQVQETIQRPKEVESEMQKLMRRSKEHGMSGSILNFTCKEFGGLLRKGPGGPGLDTEKLLETVSRKLGEDALTAWTKKESDKMVLVYGGATHNNLSPYPGLESWSYAQELAEKSKARFVEVDLYVPELVKDDTLLSQEAWFPLLKEARPRQVILIRRDQSSYIILMRKERAEPVRKPISEAGKD